MRALVVSLSLSLDSRRVRLDTNISPERAGPPSCLTPSPVERVRTADAIHWPELDDWCQPSAPPSSRICCSSRKDSPDRGPQAGTCTWVRRAAWRRSWTLSRPLVIRLDGPVLLLQEVYRAGNLVPEAIPDGASIPLAHQASAANLTISWAVAATNQLRPRPLDAQRPRAGGSRQRDPLTEPLGDLTAIELPLGKQRRVAVAATVLPQATRWRRFTQFVHHTNRDRIEQGAALADRMLAQRADALAIVIGGDSMRFAATRIAVFAGGRSHSG